jgi:hypothetical protein
VMSKADSRVHGSRATYALDNARADAGDQALEAL